MAMAMGLDLGEENEMKLYILESAASHPYI